MKPDSEADAHNSNPQPAGLGKSHADPIPPHSKVSPSLEAIDSQSLSQKSTRSMAKTPQCPETEQAIAISKRRFPQIDGYELIEELGQGGMGIVYKARHVKLNRIVALKMLLSRSPALSDSQDRFLIEARAVAGLHHPHIVQIFELGEHDGQPFFSMEYMDGGHLGQLLAQRSFSHRETATWISTIARAVHAAHKCGVIHRDLKPSNVLLDQNGFAKISDFGLAKLTGEPSELTRSGAILGTPGYLSPEQAQGQIREIGPQSDVFSLGVILYEMLTGRRPFEGFTEMEVLRGVIESEPVSPGWHRPATPRDLETICLKCLRKNPGERYGTALELANDLQNYLDGQPIAARRHSVFRKSAASIRRHPIRTVFVAAAVLLVVVTTGLWWYAVEHVWPSITYFEYLAFRDGMPHGVLPVSDEIVRQRETSFEISRRGRRGSVTQVRVVNHRKLQQDSAALRTLLDGYFGGALRSIPVRLESQYDDQGRVVIDTMYDYLGFAIVEANSRYPRDTDPLSKWDVVIRYSGPNNQELRWPTLVTLANIRRDERGFDRCVMFADAYDEPRRNGESVFGYEIDYFDNGIASRIVNLDADGQRMLNSLGFAEVRFELNSDSRPRLIRLFGLDGEPTNCSQGFHAIEGEFDSYGNQICQTYLDFDLNPTASMSDGVSRKESVFVQGQPVEVRLLSLGDSDGSFQPMAISRSEFDSKGRMVLHRWYNGDGQLEWLEFVEYQGNLVIRKTTWKDQERTQLFQMEEFQYDDRQLRIAHRIGGDTGEWIEERRYEYDAIRRVIAQEWWILQLDPPVPARVGPHHCSRTETSYHQNGFPKQIIHLGFDDEVAFSIFIERYNEQGQLIEQLWHSEQGVPINGPHGYAQSSIQVDDWGRPLEVSFRGADGQVVATAVVVQLPKRLADSRSIGLAENDIVLRLDDVPITNSFQLQFELNRGRPRNRLPFVINRHGDEMTVEVASGDLQRITFIDQAIPLPSNSEN